ncbi:unnamed protein product [Closterium sp. NIES-53]
MMMVLGTRESLDEDSLTSYVIQDEAMQEAKQPTQLLPQASYAAPTKQNHQQGQRGKPGKGGSGGGTKDVDEKRSTRDKGGGGGGRRRDDEDNNKGGRGRSTSRQPRRDEKPRKEKQTPKKTSTTRSIVGVVEPTVSLALEAGEDFQTVAAAVQANAMAVLLDSVCSHHLMGTKAVFVNIALSSSVKHVCRFNRALQPIEGRGTVALQGEAGKQVVIPDVLYVLGVQANLLSAGQLKESGVQLQGDGDEILLIAATSEVLGKLARHTFPDKGSDAEEAMPVAKKSDVLREFQQRLVLVEQQMTKSVLMLRSDRRGEFLVKEFTNFVNGKSIVHDLTCPYNPQENSMAEWEMRTVVKSVRTILLHIGMQHDWWHLAI